MHATISLLQHNYTLRGNIEHGMIKRELQHKMDDAGQGCTDMEIFTDKDNNTYSGGDNKYTDIYQILIYILTD